MRKHFLLYFSTESGTILCYETKHHPNHNNFLETAYLPSLSLLNLSVLYSRDLQDLYIYLWLSVMKGAIIDTLFLNH